MKCFQWLGMGFCVLAIPSVLAATPADDPKSHLLKVNCDFRTTPNIAITEDQYKAILKHIFIVEGQSTEQLADQLGADPKDWAKVNFTQAVDKMDWKKFDSKRAALFSHSQQNNFKAVFVNCRISTRFLDKPLPDSYYKNAASVLGKDIQDITDFAYQTLQLKPQNAIVISGSSVQAVN